MQCAVHCAVFSIALQTALLSFGCTFSLCFQSIWIILSHQNEPLQDLMVIFTWIDSASHWQNGKYWKTTATEEMASSVLKKNYFIRPRFILWNKLKFLLSWFIVLHGVIFRWSKTTIIDLKTKNLEKDTWCSGFIFCWFCYFWRWHTHTHTQRKFLKKKCMNITASYTNM